MRVSFFIILLFLAMSQSASFAASEPFAVWLSKFKAEAISKGISRATVEAALPDTTKLLPRVLELDRKQPESTRTFDRYLQDAVNATRVETGRTRILNNKNTLKSVADKYGVDLEVIVALWGIETSFGSNTGGFYVPEALATLAYDGRRGAYFRDELMKALQIIDAKHISARSMKGSWAGAMGQCQFMPSSFLRFAEDFNGDGRRDIWDTESDVFASTANYLAQSGWKKGQTWGRKVKVPANINRSLLGFKNRYSLQFWHDQGIRLPDGAAVPFEGAYQASVVQPSGAGTTAFIVYDNFQVILKWNKSSYFASAVGLLSDRLKGL